MNYAEICIIKRDGKREDFSISKIKSAITKAFSASGITDEPTLVADITMNVINKFSTPTITVEEIQDLVEKELMRVRPEVAKKYIIYREWRNTEREKKTQMKHVMDGIVAIDKNDVNLSNANMSSHTPAGQMMTFASEVTKDYTYKYLLPKRYAEAHQLGDIHIHDLDYYPTKTTTCIQYDMDDLFERGFRTKNGSIRTPQSIQSYATLATIIFQTNQNEQHGGQSIPAFDFFMAKGVIKSFRKHLASFIGFYISINQGPVVEEKAIRALAAEHLSSIKPTELERETFRAALAALQIKMEKEHLYQITEKAFAQTRKDTHQAMEGFIHNLNTMHSRGGNQVVFSSINYGTDTSAEGRMVIEELLKATIEGLGERGEVPVFPIQIFKVKDGVSYSDEDMAKAMTNFEAAEAGELKFSTPNFDLFLTACRTTAKALFPNFMFLDAPFNLNDKWEASDPKRYRYELATMGCRTRVYENVAGEKSSLGRGNLSFTTLNMPRLAIEARIKAEGLIEESHNKDAVEQKAKEIFLESVREMSALVAEQLYARYQYQRTALPRQFPFMMGNDVWKGGAALDPGQEIGDVLRSGTLGIGFIGGHNAMVALYGDGHAHKQQSWDTLYEAVMEMNRVADEYKAKYNLNYSVLATPAEGLSGRFTRMDRRKYGTIAGVTDKDYYVNSFHIDVKEAVSITEKIKLEAPFHAITRGGHITYVELDGEAQKNIRAIAKIVKVMHDEGIGYGSINHPVDTCHNCGYKGVIFDKCPVCQSEKILRMRRITGYLTGDLNSWNSAKRSEEKDRVKHN
ncbi:anaerobic ribonucleoside triphosphate reductase [Bacteroides sp.]|uniref:anaerobic ribonucleoside triphosphate reductase n=1 Tax=Bacteroides sp. TaxID=29523 RepID=UPI001B5E9F9B|nr:anaerobic ribonucleoside triphosphate reductase [Bacteroides sp.]MBP6064789.1 anaerobic ribonucleoside triphosphate reductase [Bacteroides sp.]MBP6067041.1 anaerobic ribonucleoside triphosphate reductase [Bacteroides sp.]MBP6935947.1 anaerobic ribonucleoside triphosphate reductase [Bacteroides sp.]MBP8621286.1 anaerobic ribonucleoside triphosphate reductase [Bacteroides sp.]MBP9507165.1 anaerobic ribonucleoside triphosphate reductase [Bacteroides sp.]